MAETLRILIDGQPVHVPAGSTVAVAVMNLGAPARVSVTGEARAPLCGMGVCYECRVTIDGAPHQRSCMIPCEDGMEIRTGG